MEELVKGVWHTRPGDSMEEANIPSIKFQLIASWDGTEVIRQEVPAGKRFGLRPDDGWQALEHLYIIQGFAIWEDAGRTVRLGPGDSLSGKPVREPCILTTETDLVALYVCSQPVFHQVSSELDRLRELAVSVEVKDGYTADHCNRIQSISARVGTIMGLNPTRQHYLLFGSFLHDLGKVRVPDYVLKKPGKLTADEWSIMKQHTVLGGEMLMATSMAGAAIILEQHHERPDGSGYPRGLSGSEISLEAQIVAVADSYDAMTSDRIYRAALPLDVAIAELKTGGGRQYRPDVLEAFFHVIEADQSGGV